MTVLECIARRRKTELKLDDRGYERTYFVPLTLNIKAGDRIVFNEISVGGLAEHEYQQAIIYRGEENLLTLYGTDLAILEGVRASEELARMHAII